MISIEINEVGLFIVIKEDPDKYYLQKVIRRGSDVYSISPALGMHYSLHEI
ncbi:hypothetical protein ACFLUS_00175 [Chloroflexota bacterium]